MHSVDIARRLLKFIRICAFAVLAAQHATVTAQSANSCTGDPALSICALHNTTLSHTYDPLSPSGPPPIDFTAHSCKWQSNKNSCHSSNVVDYLVRIDGHNNSTSFLLTGPGGETLPVSLTYADGTGNSFPVPASGASAEAAGALTSQPASISVTLDVADPLTLAPGTYSETFSLTVSQSGGCGSDGCAYLSGIEFAVTVTVPTRITVRNFDDMDLSSGITLGQPIEKSEDFCVGGIGFDFYTVALSSGNGATGGAGASPFQLDGNFDSVPYSVAFIDSTSSNSGIAADGSGNVSGSFARMDGLGCTLDNARVFITVAAADWEAANGSQYSDTLTITVTAQ